MLHSENDLCMMYRVITIISFVIYRLVFPSCLLLQIPGGNFNRRVTGVCHLTPEIAP